MTVNIHQFAERFWKEYDFLYKNCDRVAGYDEAVRAFDEALKNENFQKFVGEFVKYGNDFVSSDREAAAFMFALESMALWAI